VISRRSFVLTGILAAASPARRALGASSVLVDDWSGQPLGARGVPRGWSVYETPGGHPRYDFTIVEDAGRRALELRSADDHPTIAKEVAVDLAETPVLEWAWRVISQPAGADLTRRATSDASGHIFVVWPRFPAMLRSRLIGYIWDPVIREGEVVTSPKTGVVRFVVARSGGAGLGEWAIERHDVAADYRRIWGEPPPPPRAVALSIDTNDTRAPAVARFGRIAFLAGTPR
jgi:Protein of unknown function (DUF3047)